MGIIELFVRRPVLTITIMVAMIFFGILGYVKLPVAALPQVDFPTLSVSASLPGADPETMASSVATPLEKQFSSIEGLRTMNSSSSQGTTTINLQFDLSRRIDAAAMDVQAAISRASGLLPPNMPSPPTFYKINPAEHPIYYMVIHSDAMPLYKVNDYAETIVSNSLAVVPGVAQVINYSQQKFTVRIRVNPDLLAAKHISVDEITNAVSSQNVNLPLGTLDGKHQTRTLKASGQLMNAKAYEPIIVSYVEGQPVRLDEVATVEDSIYADKIACYYAGKKCVALAIQRQPGSNTISIVDEIERVMPSIRAALPPTVQLEVVYDMSESIRASVDDVKLTLVLAIVLVVLVVFIFLRNVSATIIASIAIPLSIVSTFIVMYLSGFSLDNLSLMALVLSVGFVVDDAIVVLENIVRHLEMGKKPFQAALDGAKEIVFTIVSMTSSLAVVFTPIMFMAGIYGRVLNEFAVTITVAILVSGVVALMASPMLSSRLLRPQTRLAESDPIFGTMLKYYTKTLGMAIHHRRITLGLAVAMLFATGYLFYIMPKGFIPAVDMNYLIGFCIGDQGVSPDEMENKLKELAPAIQANPQVRSVLTVSGYPQRNQGFSIAFLKDRPPRTVSAQKVMAQLAPVVNSFPSLLAFYSVPPLIEISTEVSASPYLFILQSPDTKTLFQSAEALTHAMYGLPQITGVNSNLYVKNPEAFIQIDRDKASSVGITARNLEETAFSSYGQREISNIYGTTDTYKVVIEVEKDLQRYPEQLTALYMKNDNGEMVRLDAVADVLPQIGPLTVNHYGQLPSVTVSFDTAPGFALGQATEALRELAAQTLPSSVSYRFGGTAEAFEQSIGSLTVLLFIAIVIIYMILACLYESFLHPLTIIAGLPSAAFGGLLVLWLFGMELNLYGFVGLFMLIGIVKKNAIMVVDFAIEAERHGKSPLDAAVEGSIVRFRPIMMTTIAAIAGMAPIAWGYGAGGDSRQPLGLAVVGGLLLSQVVTLYLTPVVYSYLAAFQEYLRKRNAAKRELLGIPDERI
ncbi:efflux RND transporter permease subunit [Desulfomonile tiedjei]|uniref:Cation/multidrug efflux pump n=1 Tax=Desulfomonile tiedjei (strain ATCC 49306 / DSM 6799 / DCB-1) TaxID=706587 RepID=I4C6Y7_DESTA|nr:efflux RND transporter permease subunit [Desulfomonile tiedjei]AFM25328.1 cation/multidrug efflux pump [Desulfomonile tiedjei DSM 6799]